MITPGKLRVAGAAGSLLCVGASALVVATAPRPGTAPLRPPIDPNRSATGGGGAAAPPNIAALVIPATSACGGGAPRAVGKGGAPAAAPTLDPALAPVAAQLGQATSQKARTALLATLTPDQRMQLTAYLAAQRAARGGAAGKIGIGAAQCRDAGGGAGATPTPGASIDPTIVSGGTVAPVSVSAVS